MSIIGNSGETPGVSPSISPIPPDSPKPGPVGNIASDALANRAADISTKLDNIIKKAAGTKYEAMAQALLADPNKNTQSFLEAVDGLHNQLINLQNPSPPPSPSGTAQRLEKQERALEAQNTETVLLYNTFSNLLAVGITSIAGVPNIEKALAALQRNMSLAQPDKNAQNLNSKYKGALTAFLNKDFNDPKVFKEELYYTVAYDDLLKLGPKSPKVNGKETYHECREAINNVPSLAQEINSYTKYVPGFPVFKETKDVNKYLDDQLSKVTIGKEVNLLQTLIGSGFFVSAGVNVVLGMTLPKLSYDIVNQTTQKSVAKANEAKTFLVENKQQLLDQLNPAEFSS